MVERQETRWPLARILIQVGASLFLLVAGLLTMALVPAVNFWAVITAMIFLTMAMVTALVHVLRPQDAPQRLRPVSQVLSFLLTGLALLIPTVSPGKLGPNSLFALFLVVIAGSAVANWRVWGAADELMRRMLKDSWALAFGVTSGVFCVYAAGERLGILSGITFWGFFVFGSLVNVLASYYTIWRHGQDQFPREE